MNLKHKLENSFQLSIVEPTNELVQVVQGIWFATVSQSSNVHVSKLLLSDGGRSIVLNLGRDIQAFDQIIKREQLTFSNPNLAHQLTLPPGTKLCGIKMQPGVLLKSTRLQIYSLFQKNLVCTSDKEAQLQALHQVLWANMDDLFESPSKHVLSYLDRLNSCESITSLSTQLAISQRQIERHFQKYIGMRPKQFQRLMRIKQTFEHIKSNRNTNLAQLAVDMGFSDQAHMIRESQLLVGMSPGKYAKRYVVN